MKVLHVCSEDAVPMQNIYSTYEKYFKEGGVISELRFEPDDVTDFDIIHGHYALTKPVIRAYRKAKRKKIPFVLHCHGSDVRRITRNGPKRLPLHHRFISGRLRKKADMVLLSTPDLMGTARGLYLPNPVDIDKFRPMDMEKRDKILLLGRFTRGSGILKLIDENKQYDCINWGDDIDFPSNVKELDFVSHEELPSLFNKYEMMIGALIDPVSLARLEAMACGLKTYTDFPNKYLGFYGFENPDTVKDPRRFIKKYHHPKKIVKVLIDLYKDLIGKR